jgi:hypothetical protein
MYKIVLFILMVSISTLLHAQQQKDFAHYNNETYQLYLDANWESLVELGKESKANEFDFY